MVAKRTDRWRGQEVREGGSRSPRGRTRVTTTRIRDTRVFCARTRYTYDAAQHRRVHRSARARCSVDRGRVYICLRVCGVCVCVCAYMRVGNARTSASVVIRRSYGGGIMSSHFCVGKTEPPLNRISRKYIWGGTLSRRLFCFDSTPRTISLRRTRIVVRRRVSPSRAWHLYRVFAERCKKNRRKYTKIDATSILHAECGARASAIAQNSIYIPI